MARGNVMEVRECRSPKYISVRLKQDGHDSCMVLSNCGNKNDGGIKKGLS